MSNISLIENYFKTIESGDLEGMLKCYDESAIQLELPNRLKPQGDKRSVSDLERDFAKGTTLLKSQSYTIVSVAEDGDRAAVEVLWRGQLALAIGSLREGDEMKAHSAIFFEFKDGLIVTQKNYDCFEAF